MDKCREQFEGWAKDKYMLDVSKYGGYISESTQHAWQAWQASRQALVVELPENGGPVFKNDFAEGVSSGANIYRFAVECALDNQGIRYK